VVGRDFFTSYVSTLLGRDLPDIAKVRDGAGVERLLRSLAARSAGLMSSRSIAGELGVDHKTVAAQTRLLEELFLVSRLRPWYVNLGSRHVKTPKIHMIDTGLLTHLMNVDAEGIAASPTVAGPIAETFAVMELAREVKAGATVIARDFAGLRYLRDKLGDRFKSGVVLYTGKRTLSFGDRLAAVPLCGLWVPS
jgi:predicted AAA+ superfamily ATPase